MTSKPILYIVIPCYNEEKVLPETEPLFLQTLRGMISEGKIAEVCRVNMNFFLSMMEAKMLLGN